MVEKMPETKRLSKIKDRLLSEIAIHKEVKERYKKLQRVGMGASGTAFRVRSTLTGKLYLLKKLDIIDMTLEERARARDST